MKIIVTFVNALQTRECRREKYHLCRTAGCTSAQARAMRDFRLTSLLPRVLKLKKRYLADLHLNNTDIVRIRKAERSRLLSGD